MAEEKIIEEEIVDEEIIGEEIESGFFTKAGSFIDRHKKKIIAGIAVAGAGVVAAIWRNKKKDDNVLYVDFDDSADDDSDNE